VTNRVNGTSQYRCQAYRGGVRDDGLLDVRDDGLGDTSRSNSTIDQALTGGQAQTVGRFRFFIDDERWEWSDEVQQIHG
jgi:hypothetical protein